jgi:hypothetical protein
VRVKISRQLSYRRGCSFEDPRQGKARAQKAIIWKEPSGQSQVSVTLQLEGIKQRQDDRLQSRRAESIIPRPPRRQVPALLLMEYQAYMLLASSTRIHEVPIAGAKSKRVDHGALLCNVHLLYVCMVFVLPAAMSCLLLTHAMCSRLRALALCSLALLLLLLRQGSSPCLVGSIHSSQSIRNAERKSVRPVQHHTASAIRR